ncbi:STAS/SEC14 domain-containing protein [Methylomonas sp. MO1]|uniref:STAS/SEC14 domain-containing protein n=1 Tax=Methylomonas sp. MO1 TaxID=3073619 RepID=UPI0028A507ED|nr:STAS/SEC14 domain-containing protein [Methylomonas sp. MO1]MDT4290342.1 STAS/SEC14 domain-containing protein [Methylomonas sp. MO1]
MSAEIISQFDGIVTVKITGKLTHAELTALQQEAFGIIGREGGIRVLIIYEDFQGWAKEGDWDDVSFQTKSDPYINKMALVGDKQWEELALMFTGQGFREFAIEYFEPDELDKAQAWLKEY